jgi:Domain of unknown function (DUF4440)
MKPCLVAILCGLLSSTVVVSAANNNDPNDEKAIMATLEDMGQATIKKDTATLDKIYHPDLTYSHSSAMLQDKAAVLKSLQGKMVTESVTFHDNTIRIFGNTALIRGGTEIRNGAPGALVDNHLNILYVMLRGPGPHGWQIVARQTTRLPEKK